MKKNVKLGLGLLTVLATPLAVNAVDGHEIQAEYKGNIFYANGQPANWWYSDGKDWFFFQNGKKLTGVGRDNAGSHYFVNGKYANGTYNGKNYKDGKEVATPTTPAKPKNGYVNGLYYVNNQLANWWYDDGQDWYFFQNGKKLTGQGRDNAGVHNFVNGKYAKETVKEGYVNGLFYVKGQLANWWYSDGKDWFFFKDGKKLTGQGRDNAGVHNFANGKYAKETVKEGYVNGLFYVKGQLANWWYSDGKDWFFFKDGKKLTGQGRDNAGVHNFVNGKYAKETVKEGYVNGLFYVKGQLANWWYSDGKDWYFFKDGKKLTGEGKDNARSHYFVNGKYANGTYNGKTYKDGKETKVVKEGYVDGIFYVKGEKANWWYSDGKDWFFFKDGKKLNGEGKDNAGSHYFVNGKYANGTYNGKTYKDGKETKVVKEGYVNGAFYVKGQLANWWYSDGKDWYFFKDGKKLTGEGKDNAGSHYFVNGKYANGTYNGKSYVNGKESYGISYAGYYKVTALYAPIYNVSGQVLSNVSRDTVVFRTNGATRSGRIPVESAGLKGYMNTSQLKAVSEAETPYYVSDGKYVYHKYPNISVAVAYHNANMQVGKKYYSADGINFGTFKLDHPFQFMNLKSKTNYTASDLNRLYNLMGAGNSKLAGKGATFKAAEARYGVNALYLVAHSALESAWGKSKIAQDKNNFFGISAYDSNPYNAATKFDNVDAGILGAARWINQRYLATSSYPARGAYLGNKAGGMNVNYATAPYWGESIASIMFNANDKLGRKDK